MKVRDYPIFRKDYVRLMQGTYGEDPYALKQCLTGEELEVIKGVEDDCKQMFERLDAMNARNILIWSICLKRHLLILKS